MSMTKHCQWIMENIFFLWMGFCLFGGFACLFGFLLCKKHEKIIPQIKSNLELGLKGKFFHMTGNSGVSCVIVIFFRGDIVHGIRWTLK